MKKIGFVIPWYGEDIPGGAEAELRGIVHHLAEQGVKVEVLTTCVKSFQDDWDTNYYRSGLTIEAGIPVRRFKVRKRNRRLFDEVNLKLMKDSRIDQDEESIFCQHMINSDALYQYMRKQQDSYSAFAFIPYMFGTTYYGCQIAPQKSVLIPCFHNESYVYMECFQKAFSQVGGMIFNAEPEKQLAKRLFGVDGEKYKTFGIGLSTDWKANPERFRAKYHINEPFILYAGRKEPGKRVDQLISYFLEYKKRNPGDMKLVLIGGGDIEIPDPEQIIDLGYVDTQDKYDAYGAATLFCNPSQMESFSFVIMESWLAERPVLVNGKCDVTRSFVVDSSGGLYYDNVREFEATINYIVNHQSIAKQMGQNGRRYVLDKFDWKVITPRYIEYFQHIAGEQ